MRTSAEVDKSVGNRFAYRVSDTPKGRVSWTIRVNPLSPTTFKKARFFKRVFLRLEFMRMRTSAEVDKSVGNGFA
jgi:hypothetical protein